MTSKVESIRKEDVVPKERRTRKELEALLRERTKELQIAHLEVRPDPTYGWAAFVVADPRHVADYQMRIDMLANDLRREFDLRD